MRYNIFIFLFILIPLTVCSDTLDEKRIKANKYFIMRDKLIATIVQSSDKNDIGKNLIFAGLFSDYPKVIFESGMTYTF